LPNTKISNWTRFYPDTDFERLQKLKTKYADKIAISVGVEMDWFEEHAKHIRQEINKRNYDFVLGSIHFMKAKNKPRYVGIHMKNDQTDSLLKSYGGIENTVKEYYRQTRLMARSGLFDCIGHIDRIKLTLGHLFNKNESWYTEEIEKTLDTIKNAGICTELNTSGLNHPPHYETYPNKNILKEMKKRNIPITIGTDGHTSHINDGLKKGYDLARQAGYKTVNIFQKREKREISI